VKAQVSYPVAKAFSQSVKVMLTDGGNRSMSGRGHLGA
jgi:hypothetical protein